MNPQDAGPADSAQDDAATATPGTLDPDGATQSNDASTVPTGPMPPRCETSVDVRAAQPNPAFVADIAELTSWTTYQGNAAHDGWVHLSLDPARFAPRWSFEDYGRELSAVTVDRGVVALGSDANPPFTRPGTVLHTLSAQNGRLLWTYNAVLDDSLAPPAIADGAVYAQVGAQGWARVIAFDVRTGAALWSTPFETQWPEPLSPTADGDALFISGGKYGGMYALERATGAQRWYLAMAADDHFTPTPRAHDVLAFVGDSLQVADRSSGKSLQKLLLPGATSKNFGTSVVIEASPQVIVGVLSNQLFAFDLEAGKLSYALKASFVGQAVIAAGTLYVRNGSALEARNPLTGDLFWSWSADKGAVGSQFLVTDNLAFVTTDDATRAIDLKTHQEVWSYPEVGEVALGQGTLFIAGKTRLSAIDVLGDRDNDALPDWRELRYARGDMDPHEDPDHDGLDNLQEATADTLPGCGDSDGDAVLDGEETALALDPNDPDSDADSLNDGEELKLRGTNPKLADSDDDGVADDLEVTAGFDPKNPREARSDADGDGYVDAYEVLARTNPQDASSTPRPTAWAMYQGNARHDGYQPMWLDGARFAPAWTASVDEDIRGVALAERHVVLTTQNATHVFDAEDGRVRWRERGPSLSSDGYPRLDDRSPPSLYEGKVLVHIDEAQSSTLWIRDARTGALRYRRHQGREVPRFLAPTVFEGRVHMNGGEYNGVVTLGVDTGDTLWTSPGPQASKAWEPAITEDAVWLVDHDTLRSFDRSTGASKSTAVPRLPSLSPVLDADGNAYFGGQVLTSVDCKSGARRWTAQHGPRGDSEVAVGNGRVYAIRAGVLEVFHPLTGRRLWSFQPSEETLSSNVVVTATHVFVASLQTTYAIDLRTHLVIYQYPLGGKLAVGGEANLAIFSGKRVQIITLEGDVDGDGIAEWWERQQDHDVTSTQDDDGDGLDALGEYLAETHPEQRDSDLDGLTDKQEVALATEPLVADSDGDTLVDGREVQEIGSNPLRADSDGDGVSDLVELSAGFSPTAAADAAQDSDQDGFTNRHELLAGSKARDAASVPNIHDWAMYRGGPEHASAQPILLDPTRWSMAWSTTPMMGGWVIDAPAIDADKVYVYDNGTLRALSTTDGSEAWSAVIMGEASAPTIGGGKVYVHASSGIYAFEKLAGKQVFHADRGTQFPGYLPPTLSNGVLLAPAGAYGGMVGLDASAGTKLWELSGFPIADWEPTVRGGRACVASSTLRSYDALTGAALYTTQPKTSVDQTTLALSEAGTLLAGASSALVAFDATSGAERWRAPSTGRKFGLPGVLGGRVYAVRDGMLEVFDEASGDELWTWQPEETLLPDTLVVTATHVLVGGAHTTYAVDLTTKEEAWRYAGAGQLSLSAQGLLVIDTGSNLIALRPMP